MPNVQGGEGHWYADLANPATDGWNQNGQGGIYFYNDWHAETPWGATRPDYGRKEVRQFIRDNALMWLEDYHVDGLRLDMTLFMRNVKGDGIRKAICPTVGAWSSGSIAKCSSGLAAALALTSRGIPLLFQGQEFLEDGWFQDSVPVDWHKSEEFSGLVRLYRDMINLRLNRMNTTRGLTGSGLNTFHQNQANNVIAFHRWDQGGTGDDVVVVVNLSHLAHEMSIVGKESVTTIHTVPTALAV